MITRLLIEDPIAIQQQIVSYFQNIYNALGTFVNFDLINETIPSCGNDCNNKLLTFLPLAEEIKRVVFDMDPSSVPGLDSFGGNFFLNLLGY